MPTSAQLKKSLVQAHQTGDMQGAEMFKNMLDTGQFDDDASSMAGSLAQGIAQGATLGFHDEAAAALRAGTGEFFDKYLGSTLYGLGVGTEGGEGSFLERFKQYKDMAEDPRGFGEKYQTALESQRSALETARQEDPWTTGIAEVVGGLGTGGVGAAKAVAGQGLRKGAARLAGVGAGLGGAAGYGMGEGDPLAAVAFGGTPEDVSRETTEALTATGIGAGLGAGLGAATPFLGAAARGVARNIPFVTRPFTKQAKINEDGRRLVMDRLQEDIASGDITLDAAKRELADTPGMMVADLGPGLRDLTDQLAQTPTPTGRDIRATLTDRNKAQWKRVFPKLAQAIGGQDNFGHARKQLIKDMRERADRLYGAAEAVPIRFTPEMRTMVTRPAFRPAIKTANQLRQLDDKSPLPGFPRPGTMMSTVELDQVLQGMDDVVNKAWKDQPALAKRLGPMRNEFREMLYTANPALRTARKAWAGDKANDDAMDLGLRLFSDDADITAARMADMTDAEKQFVKIGHLRAIGRKLGDKSFTADITKGIFDKPRKLEAVRAAFGGRKQYDDFMNYIEQEQKMFNTFKEATANSKTAKYLAAGENPGGRLAQIIGYTGALGAGGGELARASGFAAQKLYGALSPKVAQQARKAAVTARQGGLLMGKDLEAITQPQTMGGLLATGAPVTPSAMMGGLLSTGLPQPGGPEYGNQQ
jgi:hypothetical protein